MSKKCTPLWREAHFEVKMYKTHQGFGPLLKVAMSKKCRPLWREAHFEVNMLKTPGVQTTFGRSDVVPRGRRKGLCTLSKVSKTWGFSRISKNHGRCGTFEEDLPRCISRGRRSTKTCSWEMLGGQGADFLRGVAFWSIRSVGLLRWFCVTCAALRATCINFSWQAQYFRQVEWKNRKTHWYDAVSSALNFPFLKEVSQNCFVFDVVKFKIWRSLAELLRFGCCPVQKMKKCRRLAVFLMMSTSTNEEVSQNSLVFKLADRQVDRQTDRQTDRERERDR